MDDLKVHALALHKAQKFVTDKNRRMLEAPAEFLRSARILLGTGHEPNVAAAVAEIRNLPPDSLLTLHDADYPPLLREINHAPFALYLKGNRDLLRGEFISIIGTREPSAAGRKAAARLAESFAQRAVTVVSGIARGVDSIAHHQVLSAGGKTIAVLPNGFDHYYPLENRDIYEMAGSNINLLLISEYPSGQKPQRHHFLRRNRLIAGLSPVTVFVEGGEKSGGMITVDYALKEGRDVGALSHPAFMNNSGGEKLIADGALDFTALAFSNENHPVSV